MHTIKILALCVAGVLGHVAGTCGHVLTDKAKIIAAATGELHVREDLGSNDGIRIREYKQIIHSRLTQPVSWCGIFSAAVYYLSGYGAVVPKGCAWVPSWSRDTSKVIFSRQDAKTQRIMPEPGDVVTFYFPLKKREAHVGLIKEWPVKGDYFYTIEGNTNKAGSCDGDGVYVKMRRKSDAYKIMKFV